MTRIDLKLESGIVEEEPSERWLIGGRVMHGLNWVLTEEEKEQVRTGYRCINCMEVFDSPFPETCLVCLYHVRDDQVRRFGVEYRGYGVYGPTPLDDPALEEERERERWHRHKGIILPTSGVRDPAS